MNDRYWDTATVRTWPMIADQHVGPVNVCFCTSAGSLFWQFQFREFQVDIYENNLDRAPRLPGPFGCAHRDLTYIQYFV